jgi:hypothetical protein
MLDLRLDPNGVTKNALGGGGRHFSINIRSRIFLNSNY